eukprot:10922065-Karenia_brevis.AAC.1
MGLGRKGLEPRRQEVSEVIEQAVLSIMVEEGTDAPWLTVADEEARNQVFLVTFSALLNREQEGTVPAGLPPLRDPSKLTKPDLRDAMLDAIANPIFERGPMGGRPRKDGLLQAHTLVLGQEPHATRPDDKHTHIAVKVTPVTIFLPMKRALRQRHGLASHWSTSHTQLWSAVRYITTPTEKKKDVDPEPLAWTASGVPLNLYEASQEAWNAAVLKRRRETAAMKPLEGKTAGRKNGTTKERFSKMDFTNMVIAEDLKTPADVMAYVQDKGSSLMQSWVCKQQRRLKEMIEEAFQWEQARQESHNLKKSDWSIIEECAQKTCACGADGCVWWAAAMSFFANNKPGNGYLGVDRERLAASLRA